MHINNLHVIPAYNILNFTTQISQFQKTWDLQRSKLNLEAQCRLASVFLSKKIKQVVIGHLVECSLRVMRNLVRISAWTFVVLVIDLRSH